MIEKRVVSMLLSVAAGVVFVAMLSALLADGFFAHFLLDRQTRLAPYPFTIQNSMWLVFFIGLGELLVRYRHGYGELRQSHKRLLPEDDKTVLRREDLGGIYKQVRLSDPHKHFILQRLLARCILQFQSSASIAQTNGLFNSSLELYQHEIELRYNMLRFLVWFIPTLGFVGTVVGIAAALNDIGTAQSYQDPHLLQDLTQSLGVAFYTTLLALLMSSALVFALHFVQGREESALNKIGQYCLDNLINRLYEPQASKYSACA